MKKYKCRCGLISTRKEVRECLRENHGVKGETFDDKSRVTNEMEVIEWK